MASAVSASVISAAMQAAYATLSAKASEADPDDREVTIKEMCDVVANAVANEVNATIVTEYDAHVLAYSTHIHTTTAAPSNGPTTAPAQP